MKITRITRTYTTARIFAELKGLLYQLRGRHLPGKRAELLRMADDPNIVMLGVWDGAKMIGFGSLYIIQKVGERAGHIEDVVVDEAYRGQGLGEKLMRALITEGRTRKLRSIDLTSRPSRVAANKLYQKLGFEQKETNPYRLVL